MILWTIRHTKPFNPQNVCYGRLDFDVAPSFHDEYPGVLRALTEHQIHPKRFYESPLLRCKRLAEKVSQHLGITPITAPEIIEVDFGEWENQQLKLIDRTQMNAWKNNLRSYRFPGGESFHDVDKRVAQLVKRCLADNEETLWVTHAGVIASLMHTFADVPDENFVEGQFPYALITRFDFQESDGKIQASFRNIYGGIAMPPLEMD